MISKIYKFVIALAVIAALGAAFCMYNGTSLGFGHGRNQVTATQISSFREIGQWEFLTVTAEELVDTTYATDHKVLGLNLYSSGNRLTRIYSGTLRFGFDLKQDVRDSAWISVAGDTAVTVTLPKIHLLDENFLDEAATRPLLEEGSWSHEAKAQLAQKAIRQIREHNLTPQNLLRARQAAQTQVAELLHTMGFKQVTVEVEQ